MRTTVHLDDEVLAAAAQLQRERHIGLSEAVNELARSGLRAHPTGASGSFQQRTSDLGVHIDVSNVADALELLDNVDAE